jgi:hydroxymethylglutaryl-CoA synthase
VGGLISYGAYIPYNRLQRSAIGAALGTAGGKGARAVASYDEDTTSMGVEAARAALQSKDENIAALYFATATPAYADKTNATAIHAALALDASCLAVDMAGSVRSSAGALSAAIDSPKKALVVTADVRTGLPGSNEEGGGGDAAAAFLFGDGPAIADVVGSGHGTAEFLERWRLPGERASHTWEDRFGEHMYVPLGRRALEAALSDAGIAPGDVDHLIVAGLHARANKAFVAKSGVKPEAVVDDLTSSIGNSGAAQLGVQLADVLDRAQPGAVIVAVLLADGATAFILRTGEALTEHRQSTSVAAQIAASRDDLPYAAFLTWRGLLDREPPRRPDPQPASPAPSSRNEAWKFAFTGSECTACGMRHLPPARVCVKCGAVDEMRPIRLADSRATVATFTIDRLAYTLNPPLIAAIIDFDGGGRFNIELTDVDPAAVAIGTRVEMTFRRLQTANGVHNYFWKARPLRLTSGGEESVIAAAKETT